MVATASLAEAATTCWMAARGYDRLYGGRGEDLFVFAEGNGIDRIEDFETGGQRWFSRGEDVVRIDVEGIDSFADLLETSIGSHRHASFDFGDGDLLILRHTRLSELSASDFDFV